MKAITLLIGLLLLMTACETTKQAGRSSRDSNNVISVKQGMPASEVIALLGEPDSRTAGVVFNKLIMERWNYEIIIGETVDYQELDTELVPTFRLNRRKYVEMEVPVDVYVQNTVMQRVEILLRNGYVYVVKSQVKTDFETPLQ